MAGYLKKVPYLEVVLPPPVDDFQRWHRMILDFGCRGEQRIRFEHRFHRDEFLENGLEMLIDRALRDYAGQILDGLYVLQQAGILDEK